MENKTGLKLYQVHDRIEQIMEIEDPEEQKIAWKKLEMATITKIQNILYFIKNKDSDCEVIDREIARLQQMRKSRKNKADSIKEYLKFFMENNGIPKYELPNFLLTIAKSPPSVMIENEKEIDGKYQKLTVTIDKAAIKDDLKKGIAVKGARLITNKTNLRIR